MSGERSRPGTREAAAARAWVLLLALSALTVALGAACGRPGRLELPEGPARPDPEAIRLFEGAAGGCRATSHLTAELAVSGRIGSSRVRGRLLAGLSAPAQVRLEALAPFGPPVFILVATANRASLLLPRDRRWLADAPLEDVLDAVAGVRLSGMDLLALLLGCVSSGQPTAGVSFPDGQYGVMLDGRSRAYLRRTGGRVTVYAGEYLVGGVRTLVGYEAAGPMGLPRRVRLERRDGQSPVSLVLDLREVDLDTPVDATAFRLVEMAGLVPITIDELRVSGLLAPR